MEALGEVIHATGSTYATSETGLRFLSTGSPVYPQETLITEDDSTLCVTFDNAATLLQAQNSAASIFTAAQGDVVASSPLTIAIAAGVYRALVEKTEDSSAQHLHIVLPEADISLHEGGVDIAAGGADTFVGCFAPAEIPAAITTPTAQAHLLDPGLARTITPGGDISPLRPYTPDESALFHNEAPLPDDLASRLALEGSTDDDTLTTQDLLDAINDLEDAAAPEETTPDHAPTDTPLSSLAPADTKAPFGPETGDTHHNIPTPEPFTYAMAEPTEPSPIVDHDNATSLADSPLSALTDTESDAFPLFDAPTSYDATLLPDPADHDMAPTLTDADLPDTDVT
ncbi:hypothetical protein JCM16814_09350 [Desulfobaculum senezii]